MKYVEPGLFSENKTQIGAQRPETAGGLLGRSGQPYDPREGGIEHCLAKLSLDDLLEDAFFDQIMATGILIY